MEYKSIADNIAFINFNIPTPLEPDPYDSSYYREGDGIPPLPEYAALFSDKPNQAAAEELTDVPFDDTPPPQRRGFLAGPRRHPAEVRAEARRAHVYSSIERARIESKALRRSGGRKLLQPTVRS